MAADQTAARRFASRAAGLRQRERVGPGIRSRAARHGVQHQQSLASAGAGSLVAIARIQLQGPSLGGAVCSHSIFADQFGLIDEGESGKKGGGVVCISMKLKLLNSVRRKTSFRMNLVWKILKERCRPKPKS